MSGYNQHTNIVVKNGFPFSVKAITLKHKYSDDPEQSQTWNTVAAGATTYPNFQVGYNTGFIRTGQDHWQVSVTLPDDTIWKSDWHQCTLKSEDANRTLTFEVSGNTFYMNVPSGSCTTSLSGSNGYNSLAAIKIQNNFPVPVRVKLTHQYSDDKTFSYTWPSTIAANSSSPNDQYFVVYFNTGFGRVGSDYWNIEATLDVPPYDNQPEKAFTPWRNSTKNKGCMLRVEDINKIITFTISGKEWKLDLPSGACTDNLITPNGYNTTAFIRIKNNFSSNIQRVVLYHKYSDDSVYAQSRATIAPGNNTTPLMFVEYNTGFGRIGYDYWNVTVYLTNGKYYQNSTRDKRCYMTQEDTGAALDFTVAENNFYIGLRSGACNNGMDYIGTITPGLNRDVNKRYNENAYLATHNAYSNFEEGFYYAQQSMNIGAQMSMGVTCLLLDIWDYGSDVALIHETPWLQPFAKPQSLADGLKYVAAFMTQNPNEVVTIIFEDHVTANRAKIKQAFQAVKVGQTSLWDMVFFADKATKGWNVASQGWPTLKWLTDNKVPLVVFSSKSDPFPYQWSYMSENVYGDKSIDTKTWLDARGESQPLDKLALCALNHFPTWAPTGVANWLTQWVGQISNTNKKDTALSMFNACKTKWNRLPNYWQVDFFELPNLDTATAVSQLNRMLHGLPPLEKAKADATDGALHDIGDLRLLQAVTVQDHPVLLRDWQRLASWLETHQADLVRAEPISDTLNGQDQRAAELAGAGNYALLLYGLLSIETPPQKSQSPEVQAFAARQAGLLADRLDAISSKIAWNTLDLQAYLTPNLTLGCLTLSLMQEVTGHSYEGLRHLTQLLKADPKILAELKTSDHLEIPLLLQTLGLIEAKSLDWGERVLATTKALSSLPTEAVTQRLLYQLTHEVLYATQFGRLKPTTLFSEPVLSDLTQTLSSQAINQIARGNRDLGAELLASYWCAGGALTADVLEKVVTPLTKLHLPANLAEACCADCEPKVGEAPEELASIDQALVLKTAHEVITSSLALGVTLSLKGDVLQNRAELAANPVQDKPALV